MAKFDSFAAYVLIAANLIPLLGVIWFDWSLALVVVLYWLENIIIGVYTLVKLAILTLSLAEISKLFSMVFFCVHYGAFCSLHGVVLLELLTIPLPEPFTSQFILLQPVALFLFLVAEFGDSLLLGLAALVLSHGFSLFEHFFQRGEKDVLTVAKLMTAPYPRIIVLHVTIIGGAMLIETLGSPTYLLVVLVVLKIIMDVKLHLREHAKHIRQTAIMD